MTWWRNSCGHRNSTAKAEVKAKATRQRRLRSLMGALASASAARNRHLIAAVLSTDVEIVVDSGGAIPMRPSTARGRPAAAELILQILSCFPRPFLTEHEINGEPGLLLKDGDVLVGIMSAAVTRDAISEVWVVLNPQKLIRFEAG